MFKYLGEFETALFCQIYEFSTPVFFGKNDFFFVCLNHP